MLQFQAKLSANCVDNRGRVFPVKDQVPIELPEQVRFTDDRDIEHSLNIRSKVIDLRAWRREHPYGALT